MKPYSNSYYAQKERELRARKAAAGLCVHSGCWEPREPGFARCGDCLAFVREEQRERRKKRREAV